VSVMQWGSNLTGVRDLPPVGLLPSFLVNSRVLQPLRHQTGGTVLVRKVALNLRELFDDVGIC